MTPLPWLFAVFGRLVDMGFIPAVLVVCAVGLAALGQFVACRG